MSNMRTGRLLSEQALRKARAAEAQAQRRVGWIFNIADVVLAPTTALPPPRVARLRRARRRWPPTGR